MKPYYQHAGITIYHADCREILSDLPKPDLTIMDPPYKFEAVGGGIGGRRKYFSDINAGDLGKGFDASMLEGIENWFCFGSKDQFTDMLRAIGSRRWMLITWNKPNPTPLVNNNYLPDTEYIFHCFQSDRLFGTYADKSRFFVYPVEKSTYDHPTVKPTSLLHKLIQLGSIEGDLIMDPFMGTGTTLRAAKDAKRFAIGIEIEERYCEMAAMRLAQMVLL
jgi:DNA modification methylase